MIREKRGRKGEKEERERERPSDGADFVARVLA